MTTSVEICNAALVLVGANDINSFDDQTVEARICRSIYPSAYEAMLQSYPWRFSLKEADLGGEVIPSPLFRYGKRYLLPPDFLRLISIEGDAPYEIYKNYIHTDASPCRVVYQFKPAESALPSYFRTGLQFDLARTFALALQEDSRKAETFESLAVREIRKARTTDSQQQPNSSLSSVNYSTLIVRG
jgi:hypothetical protein